MASAVTTTIDRPENESFEPATIEFGADVEKQINTFLEKHLNSRIQQLRNIHTSNLPKWKRIAEGRPLQKTRSFPFEGASNLVHQTAGEAIDDLAARVLQLTWMTSPIVLYRYFTGTVKQEEAEKYAKRAETLIQFMDYAAYDPRELNLYPRENKWWYDGAVCGRSWLIIAPESRIEAVYTGYKDKRAQFENKTLYEGPKVINADYEDILYDPNVKVFEETDPLFRRIPGMGVRKIRERVFKGTWRKADAEKILKSPDRYGPTDVKKRENQKQGVSDTTDDTMAEWDIYECYFSWWHNGKKFRLIAWYHLATKTIANCVYNFIPDNQIPILETRLTVDGRGFPDILEHYQEEISTAKNQRNDTITVSMWGINTVDPNNKNLGPNFRLAPNVFLPVKKDQFMHYDVGNVAFAGLSLQNEQAMVQQAKERAGVGPAIAGAGAGGMNKKGGYGGAMGTLSVMQDGNSRNDHRTSDFRHSHVAAMSILTDFYGFLGLGRKGNTYGLDDEMLEDALDDYLSRRMRIPTRAASASLNREISKQNLIILKQAHSAYIKETSSQMQAVMNESLPIEYRKQLLSWIKAGTRIMQDTFKNFQISDNPVEYVPNIEYKLPEEKQNAPQGPQPVPISAMASAIQRPGESGIPVLGGGMDGTSGGPTR